MIKSKLIQSKLVYPSMLKMPLNIYRRRNMKLCMKLSRDCGLFFMVETRNEDGIQPATLGSAYDSFLQAPDDVLLDWCGYREDYAASETTRFIIELGIEIRRLIRKYGKKKELEYLIGR
jgi:hypothetical protein